MVLFLIVSYHGSEPNWPQTFIWYKTTYPLHKERNILEFHKIRLEFVNIYSWNE